MNRLIITVNVHIISNNIILSIYLAISPFFFFCNNSIQSLNFISFQFNPYILFPYDLKLGNHFPFVWYIKFVVSTNISFLNYSWFCKIHLILLVKKIKITRIKFNSVIKRHPFPPFFTIHEVHKCILWSFFSFFGPYFFRVSCFNYKLHLFCISILRI